MVRQMGGQTKVSAFLTDDFDLILLRVPGKEAGRDCMVVALVGRQAPSRPYEALQRAMNFVGKRQGLSLSVACLSCPYPWLVPVHRGLIDMLILL